MIESLESLLALTVMTAAAYGAGRPVVRGLCGESVSPLDRVVTALAAGWIIVGSCFAMLGACGRLQPTLIVGLTTAVAAWGAVELFSDWLLWARTAPRPAVEDHEAAAFAEPSRLLVMAGRLAAVCIAAAALVSALAPPTAGDALCYHLEIPKMMLAAHGLVETPLAAETTYPLLSEMWFLVALSLDGPVAAQLVSWEMGLLLAGATIVLARPLLGAGWSGIAAVLVLCVPALSNQLTAPLNDAAVAALSVMALACWRNAEQDSISSSGYALAGLMAGGALATKFVAIPFAISLVLAVVLTKLRHRCDWLPTLRGAAVALVVAASVAGPWYVRAAWHRGNPVYPFFDASLGGEHPEKLADTKTPLGWHPVDVVTAPWRITFQPERFGGRGHQIGAIFLALLPGLWMSRRLHGLGFLLLTGAAYALLWYALRQNTRFLLPALPIAAVACVWVIVEFARLPRVPRYLCWASVASIAAVGIAIPVYRVREEWRVACGWQSRQQYLLQREPTYAAALMANSLTQSGDRLLSQDYRGFYFDMPVVRESAYRRLTAYDRDRVAGRAVTSQLRAAGFSHVLLADSAGSRGIRYEPTLSRLIDAELASEAKALTSLASTFPQPACLADYRFVDADGAKRRYRLIQLR